MNHPVLRRFSIAGFAALALFFAGCAQSPHRTAHHPSTDLVMEEFMIPGADPGVQLYVRNKRPRSLASFKPDNVVLFVHGATYPAETAFDL